MFGVVEEEPTVAAYGQVPKRLGILKQVSLVDSNGQQVEDAYGAQGAQNNVDGQTWEVQVGCSSQDRIYRSGDADEAGQEVRKSQAKDVGVGRAADAADPHEHPDDQQVRQGDEKGQENLGRRVDSY